MTKIARDLLTLEPTALIELIVLDATAIGGSIYWYLLLFLLYGAYAAATEGISKAWISKIVAKENVAGAIGTTDNVATVGDIVF